MAASLSNSIRECFRDLSNNKGTLQAIIILKVIDRVNFEVVQRQDPELTSISVAKCTVPRDFWFEYICFDWNEIKKRLNDRRIFLLCHPERRSPTSHLSPFFLEDITVTDSDVILSSEISCEENTFEDHQADEIIETYRMQINRDDIPWFDVQIFDILYDLINKTYPDLIDPNLFWAYVDTNFRIEHVMMPHYANKSDVIKDPDSGRIYEIPFPSWQHNFRLDVNVVLALEKKRIILLRKYLGDRRKSIPGFSVVGFNERSSLISEKARLAKEEDFPFIRIHCQG